MKFTVNGYSQEKLIKMNLDLIDSLILRVLADMYSSNSNKIEYKIINDDKYMWSKYGYILEQIPIIGSERTLIRKIDSLIEKNILKKIVLTAKKGVKGKYLYIAFDKTYEELTEYQEPHDKMSVDTDNQMTNCQEPHDKMSSDHMTKCHIKDSSIIDSSIIDSKENTHTEEIEKSEEENPNNDPVIIQQILKKYKELGLPEYEYRPDNYVILEAYNDLGAAKLFEALKIMSESEFVKNNLSINTIFKLDNLKKALNGNFKDKVTKGKVKDKTQVKETKEERAEDYYSEEVLAALKGANYAKV